MHMPDHLSPPWAVTTRSRQHFAWLHQGPSGQRHLPTHWQPVSRRAPMFDFRVSHTTST